MKNLAAKIKLIITDVDGVLTDGHVYVSDSGEQMRSFYVRDGLAMKALMKHGLKVGIITAALTSGAVDTRAKMLGVDLLYIGLEEKVKIVDQWRKELKLKWENIAYIGDDLIDMDVMKKVGFSACPADAVDRIKKLATVTLKAKGGWGCFREMTERFFPVL
jgi:3-deoxy-D-manno-octulosonate 8-phosphate phosphatase (KDO 8-P phosphatase)